MFGLVGCAILGGTNDDVLGLVAATTGVLVGGFTDIRQQEPMTRMSGFTTSQQPLSVSFTTPAISSLTAFLRPPKRPLSKLWVL